MAVPVGLERVHSYPPGRLQACIGTESCLDQPAPARCATREELMPRPPTLALLALPLSALLSWPAAAADLNVLLIADARTVDGGLPEVLDQLLEAGAPGWSDVEIVVHAPADEGFVEHLTGAQDPAGEHPLSGHLGEGAAWDIVLLAESGGVLALPPDDPVFAASMEAFVALDALVQDTGAGTMLLQTWADRDDDLFLETQEAIKEGFLAYASAAATDSRPIWTAPVGEALAWQFGRVEAWDDGPAQEPGSSFWALYDDDGLHLAGPGVYLAGLSIFTAITGRSPQQFDGDAFGLEPEVAEPLEELAYDLVAHRGILWWSFPWRTSVELWEDPADVGFDGLVVSHRGLWPWVYAEGTVIESGLAIGALHGPSLLPGDGRFYLSGSELQVEGPVEVGLGGVGWFFLYRSSLTAETFVAGDNAELVLGDWGGEGPQLVIEGTLTLGGSIFVDGEENLIQIREGLVLANAGTIVLNDPQWQIPSEVEVSVVDTADGRQELVVRSLPDPFDEFEEDEDGGSAPPWACHQGGTVGPRGGAGWSFGLLLVLSLRRRRGLPGRGRGSTRLRRRLRRRRPRRQRRR